MESLYDKQHQCPLCGENFTSKRVKVSKVRVKRIEADFCTYYHGENPNYYSILVCPFCGYAYSENSSPVKEGEKEELKKYLEQNPPRADFTAPRDYHLAIEAFQRALEIARLRKEKPRVLANYSLHIAWIYRQLEEEEEEKEHSAIALEYFLEFYEKDSQVDNMGKLMFIMGELNRRLGKEQEAVFWYNRIISDKKIRDQGVIRKAREQWQSMRGYQ